MAIPTRLANARRATLTTCLCAALAAAAGTHDGAASASVGGARGPFSFIDALTPGKTSDADRARLATNTIPVTSCADDGSDGTLRKAIEGAADGDTIDMSALTCSLITLQSGALVSAVPNLALIGPGMGALTIDGNNAARVLQGENIAIADLAIAHGVELTGGGGGCIHTSGDLSLMRARVATCLEVSGGYNAAGGGALVEGNLTMVDSVIALSKVNAVYYSAGAVGGGAAVGGTAILRGSIITENKADASQMPSMGGGLYVSGAITLRASTVEGNVAHALDAAAYGGGLQGMSDISVLDGSIVSGNTATSDTSWTYGGGINSGITATPTAATVTIEHSTITYNTVQSLCSACLVGGAGVRANDSITAEYSTFDHNDAKCAAVASACAAGGGGLWSLGSQGISSHINLRNCTVSTNTAVGGTLPGSFGIGGGLMAGNDEQIFLHNTTIGFNHASLSAGGIAASSPPAQASELISTIVANNDVDTGPNDVDVGLFANSAAFAGSNSLVMSAGATVALPTDTLTVDPGLQPLATEAGATTATHALPAASPAIDAGLNPDWLGCDQRGYPHRRTVGASIDIGAFELDGEPHLFADNFDGLAVCPPAP